MDEPKVIKDIEKNSNERLRISLHTWNGDSYVDARIFYRENASDGEAWHPTKKGIRIHGELLPDLISGLEKAQETLDRG